MDTNKNAVDMYNQTTDESGFMKANRPGGCLFGFEYRILIPEIFNSQTDEISTVHMFLT